MKYLKGYLIVTSVIFHLGIVIALFWIVPFFAHARDVGKQWTESSASSQTGVVENVSEIVRGDLKYKGYWLKYEGQDLYVQGLESDGIQKGDAVQVTINEHPYEPLKTLIVTVTKQEQTTGQPAH